MAEEDEILEVNEIDPSTYQIINESSDVETVIGDEMQEEFYPRAKIKLWDNEANLSIGVEAEGGTHTVDEEGKVVWDNGEIQAVFYGVREKEPLPTNLCKFSNLGALPPEQIPILYEQHYESPTLLAYTSSDPALMFFSTYDADEYVNWDTVDIQMVRAASSIGNPYFMDQGLSMIDFQYGIDAFNDADVLKNYHRALKEILLENYNIESIQTGLKTYVMDGDNKVKISSPQCDRGHLWTYINLNCQYNNAYNYYKVPVTPNDQYAYGLQQIFPEVDFSSLVEDVCRRFVLLMGLQINVENTTIPLDKEVLHKSEEWIRYGRRNDFGYFRMPTNESLEFEVILSSPPASNIVPLSITTKELDFFYQPRLTSQEALTSYRPPYIEGSYAAYHKSKANNEYLTGKAFHIYRPIAIDANGIKYWCDLEYVENVGFNVIVPQDVVDNAAYPLTIDPTFGYGSVGGSSIASENKILGSKFAGSAGTLNAVVAYGQFPNSLAKVSLYINSTSVLYDTSLENGSSTNDGEILKWHKFYGFSKNTSAIDYDIALWTDTGGYNLWYYDSGAANQGLSQTLTYSGNVWPDPGSFARDTNKYSIVAYVNEFPSVSPSISPSASQSPSKSPSKSPSISPSISPSTSVDRFYFPSSGTPKATPSAWQGAWTDTSLNANIGTYPLVDTKSSTANVDDSITDTDATNKSFAFRRFVSSRLLASQTIVAQTVNISFRCVETDLLNNMFLKWMVWVMAPDGSSRGTLVAARLDATEFPTTVASRGDTATSSALAVQWGDRLVVEIGASGDPGAGAQHNCTIRFGDNNAADLTLANGDTGTDNPWIEFATGVLLLDESPSRSPSVSPSASPSYSPSASISPSRSPSVSPSVSPSKSPSNSPSVSPSAAGGSSESPSQSPSRSPSLSPSISPSNSPSLSPSISPSSSPSLSPSASLSPSQSPSNSPSLSPSLSPSQSPSISPSSSPSLSPSASLSPSQSPSQSPSISPSQSPSISPSKSPSESPSLSPSASQSPSKSPSQSPSISPSQSPSLSPSASLSPSQSPSNSPSLSPSASISPSQSPSNSPSLSPSNSPSLSPSASLSPSQSPSQSPSISPSNSPSISPSQSPSNSPSLSPSASQSPSISPSNSPSISPSKSPSQSPSNSPSVSPSVGDSPSNSPSNSPSLSPSASLSPSNSPSLSPSASLSPSNSPSISPSRSPSNSPSLSPSLSPSESPSLSPSASLSPSNSPSQSPSISPSNSPSLSPSASLSPSTSPSASPSASPSLSPSQSPSLSPSASNSPSVSPSTGGASESPSASPSKSPSQSPSNSPSTSPSLSPSASQSPSISPSVSPSLSPSSSLSPSTSPSLSPSASQSPSVSPSTAPGVNVIIRDAILRDCYICSP